MKKPIRTLTQNKPNEHSGIAVGENLRLFRFGIAMRLSPARAAARGGMRRFVSGRIKTDKRKARLVTAQVLRPLGRA